MKLFTSRLPIILASASPRRQGYLKELGLTFSVIVPNIEENFDSSLTPEQNALELARTKANAVLKEHESECANALIISADTVVVLNKGDCCASEFRYIPKFTKESYFTGDMEIEENTQTKQAVKEEQIEVLGKPKSTEEAFLMLKKLAGNKHKVITAVSMILPDKKEINFFDTTDVYFQSFTDSVLRRYADSGEGLDKAGAYAIQEKGGFLVERIDGALSTVVGLPVHMLLKQLIEKNIVV